jgi:uncharacterized protein YdbL (DUF1318 family)
MRMRFAALAALFLLVFTFGCASVEVKAPKDPIKVDVSMRLDVYQHVAKDVDEIENMVSSSGTTTASGLHSFLPFLTETAYAEESMGPDVDEAVSGRKSRYGEIARLESSGIVGENKMGLLEVRSPGKADENTLSMVTAENSDRMTIYRGIAHKNGTKVQDVQKVYSKRLQRDAPSGCPIEEMDEVTGRAAWSVK